MSFEQLAKDYQRVEAAIRFIEKNVHRQPSLAETAAAVGLSDSHFQRLFSRWVGISPKRFMQYLTLSYAKRLLSESTSVLHAAYDAGLSGPGRLHDLFVNCEAVTPGEYKLKGQGIDINYGFHASPFGECMLAVTARGICALSFLQERNREPIVKDLRRQWPHANITADFHKTSPLVSRVFDFSQNHDPAALHLYVKGTNFQIKVWDALLKIPLGRVATYESIARHIGLPRAARAVGNAVGQNPIPFLIPCHRVIRKSGAFGNYGSGPARKKAMLGWEAARIDGTAVP